MSPAERLPFYTLFSNLFFPFQLMVLKSFPIRENRKGRSITQTICTLGSRVNNIQREVLKNRERQKDTKIEEAVGQIE
jgi:hypothetical protein